MRAKGGASCNFTNLLAKFNALWPGRGTTEDDAASTIREVVLNE